MTIFSTVVGTFYINYIIHINAKLDIYSIAIEWGKKFVKYTSTLSINQYSFKKY